ncbi:hypothetical protein FRC09_000253, partial [Ceratobasidium sp. 395]
MSQTSLTIPVTLPQHPAQQRNIQAAMMQSPSPSSETPPGYGSLYKLSPSAGASKTSVSSKYALAPDPSTWGLNLLANVPEPDDYLHNPDPRRDRKNDADSSMLTRRGFANLG